jgi:radical SAM-linked protein
MRGCVKGCRFCQAGYVYRPLRERDPKQLAEQTTELLRRTGYEEVSLLSLSTGDYSGVNPLLKELMDRLAPERVAVSLPSTRVDALSPRLLEQIRRVRKTGFTLAPEAGTQRLRDVIQKEYREEELLDAARLFAELGWRSLKLYFMIGLPSETEEDVLGIAELAARVSAAAGGRLRVTASVSTFSPKPHTPFQWAGQLSIAETRARQVLLRRELAKRRIDFKWHDAEMSFLEGIFSRGDRRLADVIETAQRRGARFDGWSDHCRLDVWRDAMAEHALDPEFYLRRRPLGETLPWDHLDAGLSKRFLLQDLSRAVSGLLTPDCSIERCTYCGACDFESVRNVDFHPEGAKGGDHRGCRISRWAEMVVPDEEPGGLPAWETRAVREIRTRVAERVAARAPVARVRPADAAPLPAQFGSRPAEGAAPTGEGNAEEWLAAVPSSLAPLAASAPAVQRVRIRYRKVGPARFIGMRELGTIFLRASRRARLPVAFSSGHHPMPRMSFGPALPLGFSSEGELIDVDLTESLAPDGVLAALRRELPEGMEPIEAVEVPRSGPSIEGTIDAFVYDVDLGGLSAPPSDGAVASAVARFADAAAFPVTKHAKNGTRSVDARRLVRRLAQTGPGRLRLELAVEPSGGVKPSAVVGALLAIADSELPVLRVHKVATHFHAPASA